MAKKKKKAAKKKTATKKKAAKKKAAKKKTATKKAAKKKNATKKAAKKKNATKKKAAKKKNATKKKATKKKTATKKAAKKKTATKKAAKKKTATKKAAKPKAATPKPTPKKAAAPKPAAAAPADPPKDDSAQKGIYDETTLNWTDLTGKRTGATALGSNKFYKAHIHEVGGQFECVFNYGRVGQSGQFQRVRCATLDAARRTLQKKINSKLAKGYVRVEMRSEHDERAKAAAKGVDVAGAKKKKRKKSTRTFHPQVRDLLKIMYGSVGKAVRAGLSSSAGASEAAPLGNLHDSQLDRGADLLDAIEKAVENKASHNRLIDLTNDYLSAIPRNIDHARRGGRLNLDLILLKDKERIEKEREFLTLLRDTYLQKEVFAEAAESDDPVEVWYEGLSCALEALERGDEEFERVRGYFDKGQSPRNSNFFNKLEVRRAWRLERNGKQPGFESYASKMLARPNATGKIVGWHGTRTENLMGISRSGLLMPENLPKGVHITGKAFGDGIYHAPCWPDAGEDRVAEDGQTYKRYNGALKSMNYTSLAGAYYHSHNTASLGYMFLEEIALGVPEVHLDACWGRNRPAKGYDYIYAKAFGNPRLSHDEIVTFHEDASRLTHLLEIGPKR